MKKEDVEFCRKCALPLVKRWNKKYDGKLPDFCNDACRRAHKDGRKPKGPRGSVKTAKPESGHRDFFNE